MVWKIFLKYIFKNKNNFYLSAQIQYKSNLIFVYIITQEITQKLA